jgi:hypothetical protein
MHTRMPYRFARLLILSGLVMPTGAGAQPLSTAPAGSPPSASWLASSINRIAATTGEDRPAFVFGDQPSPDQPDAPPLQGRPCDGCPPRRVGRAFLQVTGVNVFYGLANLVRGEETAKVTPKTWWSNMKTGFEWDLNDFPVNQIGHPYQGNNYFTTGRSNGLSFYESAALTAFGSGTWEYFGETNRASFNDLINTTLGGIAIGEVLHRSAWLMRDTQATGRGRLMREIGATVLDPMSGYNRFMSGDASRVSEKPPDMVPSSLLGFVSAGALWRGSNTGEEFEQGKPFVELDMLYGDATRSRSRTPYDAFVLRMRLGGGGAISEARIRGRLVGQPFRGERFQLDVLQAYDFQKNKAYEFGAQAFEVRGTVTSKPTSRIQAWFSGWGGLTALGAVDSLGVGGEVASGSSSDSSSGSEEDEARLYDYGPGSSFGASALLARDGRIFAAFVYQAYHLFILDGVRANHLMQQGRVDLMAPLRGSLGAGVSAEYFERRTYYEGAGDQVERRHFPQLRVYLTWRLQ